MRSIPPLYGVRATQSPSDRAVVSRCRAATEMKAHHQHANERRKFAARAASSKQNQRRATWRVHRCRILGWRSQSFLMRPVTIAPNKRAPT